ncbi:MAG TPA: vanadium-dependent haloperoxidase [Phycisphaerales bacterium]|nr:vanadium-dependent haloperoxidase [Phycisphaerales bacterium]
MSKVGVTKRRVMRGWGRSVCALGLGAVSLCLLTSTTYADSKEHSIARIWNEALLASIRKDFARPPIHARNLYHVSAAMWDAWAVYDADAIGVFGNEKAVAKDVAAARREAISYAAYRVLKHRFANSPGAAETLPMLANLMVELGYDPEFDSIFGTSPAAIGNRCGQAVIDAGFADSSNEAGNFQHPAYEPINDPLVVEMPGSPNLIDPNRWQSIWLNVIIDQQGNVIEGNVPKFIGPHWGFVTPFALGPQHATPGKPGVYLDQGDPPYLYTATHQEWIDTFTDVIVQTSKLDPDSGEYIDISPGVFGNNSLGKNDGTGHPINPATGKPYQSNLVKLGDYTRVLAEFWADGPQSSTPPGHWNEVANDVVDHPMFERRMKGQGPILDPLEWDVKMYLAINGGAHDAAVACWGTKGYYDYVRPISAIRYMADRGQSTDPKLPSYHPAGLPLIPGIIELITEDTIKPGEKHHHLAEMVVDEDGMPVYDENNELVYEYPVGEIAVMAWPGVPSFPWGLHPVWVYPWVNDLEAPYSGVRWIRAKRWVTYQLPTFITPPFAGYTSGHSTYSRTIAEILTFLTGTPYFPGGIGEYHFPANKSLHHEQGPSVDLTLQWGTYFDASDQSARSRIYGGIHPYVDDFPARRMGHQLGAIVFAKALEYFNDGTVFCPHDINASGAVDVQDLLMLLGSWGACPGLCPADLNKDAVVDVLDLLMLLGSWGPCS